MEAMALRAATAGLLALLLGALLVTLLLRRRRVEDRRAPFLGHVEELRRRLLWPVAAFVGATLFCLTFRVEAWNGLPTPRPALFDNLAAQAFAALADRLVPAGVSLIVTTPLDGFSAHFGMAAALGFMASLPVFLHQCALFAAPALRPAERRLLAWTVLPATALFAAGALFALAVVLPVTLEALYQFSDALGAEGLLQVSSFVSFTLAFVLGFGLAFQLPLVMAALSRVGLVAPAAYWRRWRHAAVGLLVAGMVLTPDPTIFSQVLLAIPLFLLYILGALLASRVAASAPRDA